MYSRRDFGKAAMSGLALAALPASRLWAQAMAAVDSTVRGVKLGIEFSISPIRWYTLDPEKLVVVRPGSVDAPDLSKVDEVGFVDLMPSGGHGNAGWVNVGPIEVYGKSVKR